MSTVALLAAAAQCAGCAALAVADAVTMVQALPPNQAQWVETNRLEFAYPVGDVYEQLVQGVERSGRSLLEQEAATHTLLVSYPFSLLKNHWGGRLRITCAGSPSGTTVTVEGDGRDARARVRTIGDEVLEDVGRALRRQARAL